MMLDVDTIARALGGEVSKDRRHVLAPGPGHSVGDRSLSVTPDENAPDGFLVNTFSPKDNPTHCRQYVRGRLGLTKQEPNGRAAANGAAKSHIQDEYIYRDENGEPYLRVLRITKPDGSKSYPQSHWQDGADRRGSWCWRH
jgi:hypothetical protein